MTKISGICWLGTPRSGSNYLTDLLANHPSIESYREIFQARGVHVYSGVEHYGNRLLKAAKKKHGVAYTNFSDPHLSEWARAKPRALLDMCHLLNERSYFSYKVFESHLNQAALNKSILSNPTQLPIIFKRDPLDCFVSSRKALLTTQFHNVDTTTTTIELSAIDFQRYFQRHQGFLTACQEQSPRPLVVLNYEDLMLLPDDYSRLVHLCIILCQYGIDVDPRDIPTDIKVSTSKQDRSPHISDTVSNWDSFLAQCSELNISSCYSRHFKDSHCEQTTSKS
jgi:hypothetical protein